MKIDYIALGRRMNQQIGRQFLGFEIVQARISEEQKTGYFVVRTPLFDIQRNKMLIAFQDVTMHNFVLGLPVDALTMLIVSYAIQSLENQYGYRIRTKIDEGTENRNMRMLSGGTSGGSSSLPISPELEGQEGRESPK